MPAPPPKTVEAVLRQADARLDQARENLFALCVWPAAIFLPRMPKRAAAGR